jgi:predicted DNA-binding transcriptional regulator AlpA
MPKPSTKEKENPTSKRLLDVPETAAVLSYQPRTLYNRCAPGAKNPFPLKPIRIGRTLRFDIRDIERFIEEQK